VNKRLIVRGVLALLAGLPLLLTACDDPTVDLELSTDPTERNAYYTDTITVRSSTVLVDSVPSSGTAYLLVGRYVDAQLGTIEGRSYLQPSLSAAFLPTADLTYDSLALSLTPDTYRYGDTTRTQQLRVHRVQQPFGASKTYYTRDALRYDAPALGQRTFRAPKSLGSLRVRLGGTLGPELWQAGRAGRLTSNDELRAVLNGLALAPGPADDAAIVRWSPTATLQLYYHDPLDPTTALSTDFELGSRHFFQLEADRSTTLLAPLSRVKQGLPSTATANQTFIEAGLGLCTKLEFPYLLNFRDVGSGFVFSSAELKLEVVSNTASRTLPVPASVAPQLVSRGNQLGAGFLNSAGTTLTIPAATTISASTGLDQTSYTLDCSAYIEAVVLGTLANDGMVLNGDILPATVSRAVLGGPGHASNPLKISAYYTRL
jgi:hypothetical protein